MDMPASGRRPRISATDAAFAGFGLVRRNPVAFAVWSLLALIYAGVATLLQMSLAGPYMAQIAAMQATGSTSPPTEAQVAQLMGSLGSFSLFYVAVLLIALIYGSVMNAAIFRAMLRPAEGGLGYLRFGKDELRQAGVSILVALVIYGVYVASIILGVVVAVVVTVGVVAMTGGKEDAFVGNPAAIAVAVLGGVVVLLAIVVPLLVVAVRLSLAAVATFVRGKVDVFGSWRLTKGRFWTLTGAYLLSALVILVISILVMGFVAAVALLAGVGLDAVSQTMFPNVKTMGNALLSPLHWVLLVINAPISALWIAVLAGIPATVYAQITEGQEPEGPDRSHVFGTAVAYPAPVPPTAGSAAPIPPFDAPPPDTL